MKKENQDNTQESWEEKLKDLISRAFNIGIECSCDDEECKDCKEYIPEEEFNRTKENITGIVKELIRTLLSQEKEKSFQEGYEKCLKDSSKPLK